ncbi:MAG: DUF1801 domain-containing protein [Dokdonella sp.]
MASSAATTAENYLAELAEPRRAVIAAVRDEINLHLPQGYVEGMGYGMIVWAVPLARYRDTYNQQPLMVVALAAQKSNYALYLPFVYMDRDQENLLRAAHADAGLKIDLGKSCLRFKSLDKLPLSAIGSLIAGLSVDDFIALHEKSRGERC